MSIVIMRKKFEAPPSKDEILSLMVGDNLGDKGKAKAALTGFIAPLKDLLALYQFVDGLDTAAEKYVEVLKELAANEDALAQVKTGIATAKASYAKATADQNAKLEIISDKIAKLEKVKSGLEDEQAIRDRLNAAAVTEAEATKKTLLAEVDKEVAKAREKLTGLNASIMAAEKELDAMVEKKRVFLASLGG